jgi:hypothetical protein
MDPKIWQYGKRWGKGVVPPFSPTFFPFSGELVAEGQMRFGIANAADVLKS